MNRARTFSLKHRMMAVALAAFVVMFAIITVVFIKTVASLRENAVEEVGYTAQEINTNIDGLLRNIQTASELLADDPRLIEYLEGDYEHGYEDEYRNKLSALYNIRLNIFSSGVNRAQAITWLSAAYSYPTGELFNFMDANLMGEQTIEQLLTLYDAREAGEFSRERYYWHPLGDNFLMEERAGNIRADNVVIGIRSIYEIKRNAYSYLHVFVLNEKQIYDCYAAQAERMGARVYVLTENGELVSSTDEQMVEGRAADPALVQLVLGREQDAFSVKLDGTAYFANVSATSVSGSRDPDNQWYTLLLVPKNVATQDVTNLYFVFGIVLFLSIMLCVGLLAYLYRQFMNPISDLSAAMKRVDRGDLNAYLPAREDGSEAAAMIGRYNRMLTSINRNIEEKMAIEQVKKELDMQVLTNQINPHFLYNTLETIVWKAGQAGRQDIGKIASSLGKLYRLSISGGETLVPLCHELEHVASYVEIQASRYKGQFYFEQWFQCPELGELRVPKIILQPIVENVFMYALPEAERPVTIRLTAKRKGDRLIIKVLDNGPGMSRQRLADVREQVRTGKPAPLPPGRRRRSTGIGLHNIKARLQMYMDADEALFISSKRGFGTRVIICIPLDKTVDKNER